MARALQARSTCPPGRASRRWRVALVAGSAPHQGDPGHDAQPQREPEGEAGPLGRHPGCCGTRFLGAIGGDVVTPTGLVHGRAGDAMRMLTRVSGYVMRVLTGVSRNAMHVLTRLLRLFLTRRRQRVEQIVEPRAQAGDLLLDLVGGTFRSTLAA